MERIRALTIACALLAACLPAAAEVTILPDQGNAAGVLIADQAGRWTVMTIDRDTFFFLFPKVQTFESGRVCAWQGKAGVYGFIFDGEDGTRETGNVVLGGDAPQPDPDPDPNPKPDPEPEPIPDGLWGLTRISYDTALAIPSSAIKYLEPMAGNYTMVAAQIAAGGVTDAEAAKASLKRANRETVPEADRALMAPWDAAIKEVLTAHDADLESDLAKIAEAFRAIGLGLELAAKERI